MELLIICLEVFFARIGDVTLATIRTIMTVKGRKGIASILGFCELFIWFLVVRTALNVDSDSLWICFAYAGGYAAGTFLGGTLASVFIKGNLTIQVITSLRNDETIETIRSNGYAVSVIDVKGQNDTLKYMLYVEIDKKKLTEFKKLIKSLDDKAFIVVNETKLVENGFFK